MCDTQSISGGLHAVCPAPAARSPQPVSRRAGTGVRSFEIVVVPFCALATCPDGNRRVLGIDCPPPRSSFRHPRGGFRQPMERGVCGWGGDKTWDARSLSVSIFSCLVSILTKTQKKKKGKNRTLPLSPEPGCMYMWWVNSRNTSLANPRGS